MKQQWFTKLGILGLACGLGLGVWAAEPGQGQRLRGFGTVAEAPFSAGSLPGVAFACDSPEHALLLLHKLGRDLAQTATVPATWQKVPLGGQEVPVLVRPGLGSFLLACQGQTVWAFTSPADKDLGAAFAEAQPRLAGARFFDAAYSYPVYLDKFSHYGIGSWYPLYWGESTPKGTANDMDSHFAFARKLDLTIQPNCGGYLLRNVLPKLREYGRPWHFAQWQEWSRELALMAPEELVLPNDKFTTMPSYYGQVSDGGRRLLEYRNWCFQNVVREYKQEPLLVDWLDPNGEVGPFGNFFYWDFSEGNRLNLVRYLQTVRGYTLKGLGQAWYGESRHFKSWNDVPIPMSYEFYGWREGDPVAAKTWRIHPAWQSQDAKANAELPWYARRNDCPPAVLDGVSKGWHKADFDDRGWAAFQLPGGEEGAAFWRSNRAQFWYRGTIEAPEKWLAKAKKAGRVYLTLATLTGARGWKNPDRVWVNGQEVANLWRQPGADIVGQLDVTALIRPGANTVVYLPAQASVGVGGPVFLTSRPREEFPFADAGVSARFRDWHEYINWCVMDKMEQTFKAIRSADPDRFIKMHAAEDKNHGIPLQARYGCFGHNTGEGGFFRPWDKRFGYPYGVPSSAEFGGYIESVPGLKRWLGWFTFEGLNAFDNFHNLQQMMYSVNKDVWTEYLPYLKLAPRRDIKRPDVALLWSPFNCNILPRPVPYCFDLGRGDLQSIGYSYVLASEATVHDGKIAGYPVLWDTGTWIMSPETVADIRAYVEAGGTFVALQETGRHGYDRRDTWPIADLTGFKVREVRPMTGSLSILVEQPLFRKLAGKTFFNRGKSIDYSDYNYADKCIALDPVAAECQAIARYEDGSIAIGLRQLGKGRVVVLGSPFWRDSYDGAGMWWPGEGQSLFLEDLLAGLGLKPLAAATTHDVWREHYLAANGTEEFLCLWNPFDSPRTFSVDWTTVNPAGALFDPKDGKPVPATVNGTAVHVEQITLGPLETRILATQPNRPPREAVQAWFAQLSRWWQASAPGQELQRPDLPVYELRLADQLRGKVLTGAGAAGFDAARLSAQAEPGPDWVRGAAQSFEELAGKPDAARRCFFHVSFAQPPSWRDGDTVLLYVRTFAHAVGDKIGPVDAWLNGERVLTQAKCVARGYNTLDGGAELPLAGKLRRDGPNVLVLGTGPNGFVGEVVVARRPAPAAELEVSGTWQVQADAASGLRPATLPGTLDGLFARKDDVVVPADWRHSRVFVSLSLADVTTFDSLAVNGKVIFHPVNWFAPVTYMDITPWVRFGAANQFTLFSKRATREWQPGKMAVQRLALQRVDQR